VPPLRLAQLGHDRHEAEFVDRGGVNAAEERASQAVGEDAAEPSAEERPDGNILVEPIPRKD